MYSIVPSVFGKSMSCTNRQCLRISTKPPASLLTKLVDSLAPLRPLYAISTLIQVMFDVLVPYILIYILLIPYDALHRGLVPPVIAVLIGIATAGIIVIGSEYFMVGPFESFCITLWVIRLAMHELI